MTVFVLPVFTVAQTPYTPPGELDFSLLLAVHASDLDQTKELIGQGADINVSDYYGSTPLILAATGGDDDIASYLIENGANVNAADIYGMTALAYAVFFNNQKIVSFLLPEVDDVDQQDNQGFTPLMFASQTKNLSVAEDLITRGANINHKSRSGLTPLMYASAFGNFYMTDLLLFYGADVSLQANDGSTALHITAYYGHEEVMGLLLEMGADIDRQDSNGNTPLMYAAMARNAVSVWYLMESGANPEILNKNDLSALSVAVSNNDTDIAELLTSYSFVEPPVKRKANSVIARSLYSGNIEMARILSDFQGIRPSGLYFSEITAGSRLEFNRKDLMYIFEASVLEARYKMLARFSFAGRIFPRPVKVYENPEVTFQFQEKRFIWAFDLQREIVSFPVRKANMNFYMGIRSIFSNATYSGTAITPPQGFSVAPVIDMIYRRKNFSVTGGYYFYRTGQSVIPSNRFRIGFQYHIPLYNTKGTRFSPIIN
ncbi:MAG: ankyrin repeat domain-containing protein [Bacteroidales bacterium]